DRSLAFHELCALYAITDVLLGTGFLLATPPHHLISPSSFLFTFQDRSLAFHELCALYAITDVLLVTSLRDGMNLVSYEYVACQNYKKGVLILSEVCPSGRLVIFSGVRSVVHPQQRMPFRAFVVRCALHTYSSTGRCFAGAAQSLGAGALLVNPWNITDMSSAIEDALTMGEEERVDRHRYNFLHVTTHTAQAWADTFVR
ncbi:unnamed protein product, partial [Closterium sp. NIES-53]